MSRDCLSEKCAAAAKYFNTMTRNSRVIHAIKGHSLKFGQVQKRIAESCCFVWVVYGETFRDATYSEAANMRKEQIKKAEDLPYVEIPHVFYRPTDKNLAATRKSYPLIRQAHEFAAAQ